MASSETLFGQESETSWTSLLTVSAPPLTYFLTGLPTQANTKTLPITNPNEMPSSQAYLRWVLLASPVFTRLLSGFHLLIAPLPLCKH